MSAHRTGFPHSEWSVNATEQGLHLLMESSKPVLSVSQAQQAKWYGGW